MLIDVTRPEPRVYRVTYIDEATVVQTEHLSTNQMCMDEIKALREFAVNGRAPDAPPIPAAPEEPEEPEEPVEEPKPKVNGTLRITGMEALERNFKASEPPISESIRGTAMAVPDVKYRTVKVVKTYTVTREDTYLVKFTDKTLAEFREIEQESKEGRIVFNYLLRRQTDRLDPIGDRIVSSTDPVFKICEEKP